MRIDKKSMIAGTAVGCIIGMILVAVIIWRLSIWAVENPATDCDTCIEGTTP